MRFSLLALAVLSIALSSAPSPADAFVIPWRRSTLAVTPEVPYNDDSITRHKPYRRVRAHP